MDTPFGLLMLVRDEEMILPESLPSVVPLIKTWVLLDTGSLDRTEQVARELLAGLPGRYLHAEWKGFAAARTELLEQSRRHGHLDYPTPDYWLMLDADMCVELVGSLPELTHDTYSIRIAGDFEMWLPLITAADLEDARYEGRAHATLRHGGHTSGYLDNLTVRELRSKSPRGDDKFRRDLAELEAEIDPRSVFYYAQTLKDLGHRREAADMYRVRVRLSSSHPEEVFWSCYQEGLLRAELDGWKAGVPIMLEAFSRRPTRAEPLWWLAHQHRTRGHFAPALMFAERAAAIRKPADRHFLLAWVYEFGATQELALVLQALGREREAAELFLKLSTSPRDEVAAFARERLRSIPAMV